MKVYQSKNNGKDRPEGVATPSSELAITLEFAGIPPLALSLAVISLPVRLCPTIQVIFGRLGITRLA
jgi:hypothetical protein